MTRLAYQAIWTTWAELLCGPCHGRVESAGRVIDTSALEREPIKPTSPDEGCDPVMPAETTCDRCGASVQSHEDAAHLKALGIPGAELRQTGGMCAGLAIDCHDGRYAFVSMLDGPIVAGLYPDSDSFMEGCLPDDEFVTEGYGDDDKEKACRKVCEWVSKGDSER